MDVKTKEQIKKIAEDCITAINAVIKGKSNSDVESYELCASIIDYFAGSNDIIHQEIGKYISMYTLKDNEGSEIDSFNSLIIYEWQISKQDIHDLYEGILSTNESEALEVMIHYINLVNFITLKLQGKILDVDVELLRMYDIELSEYESDNRDSYTEWDEYGNGVS
jgi:hypothetical protein